jgi:two-component system OmpR family sensor kinase
MTLWHSVLLGTALIVFGFSVYAGLGQYLSYTIHQTLAAEGRSISENVLVDRARRGDDYVVRETKENYAPEIKGLFIRIIRPDGSVLYRSDAPRDGSFDPAKVGPPPNSASETFRTETNGRAEKMLIHSMRYVAQDGQVLVVETGTSYRAVQSTLHGLLLTLLVGMPLVVGISVAGSYLMMRKALRPVDEITQRAEQITSRNLSERLPTIDTGDEIERLSQSLNRMIARLDDAFQHINRFSADVSHELRTPLTILRGELEGIAQHRVQPEQMEMIGSALEETDRLTRIVDHLLEISRLDAGERSADMKVLDLGKLATSTAEQMQLLVDEKGIELRYSVALGVEVKGSESWLQEVIVNLLDNAIKYTERGGWIELSVNAAGPLAVLEIADGGTGISPEALPHIFERFYRADKARSRASGGTGLGLAIVKAICTAHDAEIRVSSVKEMGSRFKIEFPRYPRNNEMRGRRSPMDAAESRVGLSNPIPNSKAIA